jgi:hypothetical protein
MPRSGGVSWVKAVAPYADEYTVILLGAHRHMNVYDIEQMIAPMSAFPHKYMLVRNPIDVTRSTINLLACLAENPNFWPAVETQSPAMYKSMKLFDEAKKAKDYDELLRIVFKYFIPSDDGSIVRPMLGLYSGEFKMLDYAVYNQSFQVFMRLEYGVTNPTLPKPGNTYHHKLGYEIISTKYSEVLKYVERDLINYSLNGDAAQRITELQKILAEMPKYE